VINSIAPSDYRLLVIIPVYNHYENITAIVQNINNHNLPCLLLDDGSNETTQQTLENIPTDLNTLIRYDINRGKGAVVCDGILFAKLNQYTHVLQVDADGQHDLNDIPKFIAASQKNPNAIVSGHRPYTAMPLGRRYGRMVTDIWANINTLSLTIKDSMCGYRLYPIEQTEALIQKTKIGARMNFDTDIIVRLYWSGLDVIHINTDVHYDSSITSHFNLWADNISISKMHATLFFGMLMRIPQLLLRKR